MKKMLCILLVLYVNISIHCREYSFSFLKLPTSARQTSLVAYSALSDDTAGIFCNPSGLTNILVPYAGITYTQHFEDIKHHTFGYIQPLKNKILFFGISGLYTSNIEGRSGVLDNQPEYVNLEQITTPEFYYDVYSIQTSLGGAKIVYNNLSIGCGIKFLYEKIYDVAGYSVATDFGVQWYPEKIKYIGETKNLTCSLAVNNLGLPVKFVKQYYSLPTSVVLGVAYKGFITGINTTFVLDYVIPFYDTSYVSSGLEILINEYISFRCGYRTNFTERYLGDLFPGLSLGTGVDYFGIKFDYSLTSFGVLGYTHKVSISLEMDKIGKFYKLLRKKLFQIK